MNENQIKRAWKIKSRYLFPPWIGYEYNKEVLNSGRRVPAMFQKALRSSVICLDMAELSYKVVDPPLTVHVRRKPRTRASPPLQ